MSVIATISVPADDFTLGATIRGSKDTRVWLDRVIPTGQAFVPYVWTANETVDAVRSSLAREEDIESIEVVETTGAEALIRIEWGESVGGLLETLVETGASVLEGIGEAGRWRLQLRFDDADRLSGFFEQCTARDIPLTVETVHGPGSHPSVDVGAGMTDTQREAVETALEAGYFDVPRGITLVELAERLGVSDSAASERLRRGTASVLEQTLPRTDGRES